MHSDGGLCPHFLKQATPSGKQRLACALARIGAGVSVINVMVPIFLALAVLLPVVPGADVPAPEVFDFASYDQCGQVLALTSDDRGRLFAAVTERSFGRGTVSTLGDPAMNAEDRASRSVAAREALVKGWRDSGRLAPLLKSRAAFFAAPGDGPVNFLTKYSESVRWLADVNQDGKAESGVTVADAFRGAVDGPGSALLALPGGKWLYGCSPGLWRLEDRNHDQRAEERALVADGFGLANEPWGADLHALIEAPDGWIYWAMGCRGYALRQADGTAVRGIGSGAVLRCRPDGSGVARIAWGLRNPTALAMLPDGRLLTVDEAAAGGKPRLLWVIPGADFGWNGGAVTAPGRGLWFEEGMEAAALGHAGEDGTPQWPLPALTFVEGWCSTLEVLPDGTLLAGDRQAEGKGGLHLWKLEDDGSTCRFTRGQTLWQGGAVMALTRTPEGQVYFADWGGEVDVAGRCRIRRLQWPPLPDAPASPSAAEPAGQVIQKLEGMTVRELKGLLNHPSPRVALRARQRLEGMSFQDSLEALLQMARRGPSPAARLHGLRGAGAVARQDPALLNELVPFLGDPDPVLRAAAANLLGEGSPHRVPPQLRRALGDEARIVKLAAAAALARLKSAGVMDDLMNAAAANSGNDALVRTSLAHALAESVPSAPLAEAALRHPVAAARLTAVLALRRQAAPETAFFLTDGGPAVFLEAARAIYDLPLRPAFPALAALLDRPSLPAPVARRALAAAAWLGTAPDAVRVAVYAAADETPAALKIAALAALASWDQPPAVDPLWQRPEIPLPRLPGTALPAARSVAKSLKQSADPAVASMAGRLLNGPAPNAAFRLAAVNHPGTPEPERLAALRQLIASQELTNEAAKALTLPANAAIPPALRAEARSYLMRRDPKAAAALTNEALTHGSIPEKQAALRTLDRLAGPGGDNEKLVLELARRLSTGTIERGIQVEVLEALQRRDVETRSPWRRAYDAWQASLSLDTDSLAPWRMTMEHGDPDAGRVLFESHAEAACLSCHSVGGIGGVKGPDLDGAATRLTTGRLLESLIQPSTVIAKGTAPPTGTAAGEGAPESPMPPMGAILTLRELRDLMAYLRLLKEP